MTPKITKSADVQAAETITMTNQQAQAVPVDAGSAVRVAVMANDISYIKGDIAEIKTFFTEMKKNFVSKDEFLPVRIIAYGMVGVILVIVLTAIVTLVIIPAARAGI